MGFTIDKAKFNNLRSPVRDYPLIWFGTYMNGGHVSEFDFSTHKENWFQIIDRNKLINFGLLGYGYYLNYFIPTGTFNLPNNTQVDVVFKNEDGKLYPITKNEKTLYNDCISYKDVESIFNQKFSQQLRANVYQFNFGYKAKIQTPVANFHFKAITTVSMERKPMFMTFRFTPDKDVNGEILILKNNQVVQVTPVKMKKNIAGETNWIIK